MLTNNENAPDARCYRIVVRGELDDRDAEWFEGFGISRRADGNTVLCGWVRDQAALHGMLDRVRDLNLTLLEVGVE